MPEPAVYQKNLSGMPPAEAAHDSNGSTPRPVNPPPSTYWPFVTAVGLTICLWGIVLNLLVVCVGSGVFVIGTAGLIGDWIREHRTEQK